MWTADDHTAYANECTFTLDEAWDVDKMNLVVAVHRKGTGTAKEVLNCEMVVLNDLISSTPGDVTGDGTVDVSDINAIIEVMLKKAENTKADITGDGTVDVSDLNAAINIMLKR